MSFDPGFLIVWTLARWVDRAYGMLALQDSGIPLTKVVATPRQRSCGLVSITCKNRRRK